MITVRDSVGRFLLPQLGCGWECVGMMQPGSEIRTARVGAVCVLTLVCALSVPASARQDSTSDTAAKKPATTKKTTTGSSTAHKSAASSATSSTATKSHTTSSKKRSSRKRSTRLRGQQKIDSDRARAIQEALIREHYLSGSPTGTWNEASEAAMRKYQADNGWQSKTVPDSRALIKLGLGPSKDHLLNPDSAMTTVPDGPKSDPAPTTAHSTPAASDPPAVPASTSPQGPSSPQ